MLVPQLCTGTALFFWKKKMDILKELQEKKAKARIFPYRGAISQRQATHCNTLH